MEERVIRFHECFSRTGGICLPAPLSKSHHDSVLGVGVGRVGCGSRAETLADMKRECIEEPTPAHILLAVVVHSVPASSFTVFISITVNTLAVESLPLVSWMSRFKTFQHFHSLMFGTIAKHQVLKQSFQP